MPARLALAIAVAVIAAAGVAVYLPVTQQQPSVVADDLWAEAVLVSFPTQTSDSSEVVALYAAAIQEADRKAPLYVALGDFYRGPLAVAEELEPALLAVQRSAEVGDEVESLIATMQGNEKCIQCYAAAVRADPHHLPGWYRLARYTEGQTALDAIRLLQDQAPDNAIGWYLEASHRLSDGDIHAVLHLVEHGNQAAYFLTYQPELPRSNSVNFPRIFGALEGRPVPPSAVEYLVQRQNDWFQFASSLHYSLRTTGRSLCEGAAHDAQTGDVESAVRKSIAAHQLAAQMLRIDPPDGLTVISGLGLARSSIESLRRLLPADDPRLMERERVQRFVARYHELIRDQYLPALGDIREIPFNDIMEGEASPVQMEYKLLLQIRATADRMD